MKGAIGVGMGQEEEDNRSKHILVSSARLMPKIHEFQLFFFLSYLYNITLGSFVRSTYLITQSYKLESEVCLNNWQCEDAAVISVKRDREKKNTSVFISKQIDLHAYVNIVTIIVYARRSCAQ